ncbi:MAG: hypothetical protein IT374_17590 [Polyangiaceae bacterium]|nr:hypothetical protein [Polyangiaceae bacterium]
MRRWRGGALAGLAMLAACIPSRRGAEPAPAAPAPAPAWVVPPSQPETASVPPATAAPLPSAPPPVAEPPRHTFKVPRLRLPTPVKKAPAPAPASGCGQVVVDGVTVPLDCWSKDYAKVQGAAAAIAREAVSSTAVPEYVDHRRESRVGPTRHQRSVGAGAAFAVASAIDQVVVRAGGGAGGVSAMQLFARAPVANLGAVVSANLGKGVAAEATLPYDEAGACQLARGEAARLCKERRALAPDAVAKADAAPVARLLDVVELANSDGAAMRETIARGQDVVLVLRVDPDAWAGLVGSKDPEPLLPDYVGAAAIQPVLVVGFAKQDGAWFFLLQNSWGPTWGAGGFAWIAEATLRKNAIEAYVVQASPATAVGVAQPASCPPGTVPDSTTKQCAPACPDKSPRNNGVCADPKAAACPPGFVNTTGRCVIAAPTTSGSDASTGVSYTCGAAGCTYSWPRGKLGCVEAVCSVSCPAPRHLAAVNVARRTVTCTE